MSGTTASFTPSRRLLVAATLLVVAGAMSGCPSSSGTPSATATPAPASAGASAAGPASAAGGSTVEIGNFAFTPPTLTVSPGTSVTWKFDDSTDHTVTADDNSFTSQPMGAGQTYEHTFATAGTLAYHCSIHPFMKGTIEVK
ncbi:cupredoxin family copper-binding protein [Actinoplanes sp. NPDC051513]|uniref:cupredoxin family copper-binding protein n=1 Tax=Actinoplanes sp. NPDC051513 TaxID=3363908 RepID=UPI003794DC45